MNNFIINLQTILNDITITGQNFSGIKIQTIIFMGIILGFFLFLMIFGIVYSILQQRRLDKILNSNNYNKNNV